MRSFIMSVTSLLLLFGYAESASTRHQLDNQRFRLGLPRSIDTTNLSISYFLSGPFGGVGGRVQVRPDTWEYEIDTSYENQAADALKVIVFCPGYEVKLLDFPALSHFSPRNVTIDLKPLPLIRLSGKVILPVPPGASFDIEAKYLAYWSHDFYGITDGPVCAFTLGRSIVSEDGSFSIKLPDFASDSTINQFRLKGVITFTAREPKTGNIHYRLERSSVPGRDAEIDLSSERGDELVLYARVRVD